MGRSETAIITLEESRGRFEEYRPSFGWRLVARKEGINCQGVACGVERSEAARGDRGRGSAATGFAGVCGSHRTGDTIDSRMHS
jgi:hypothetical protein